jgi:hypothetical protein
MDEKRPKGHNPSQKSLQRWENEGGAPKGLRKRPRDFNQAAKLVIDIAIGEVQDRPPTPEEQGKDPAAAALGRKGGKARSLRLTSEKRKEIARRAAKTRWKAR